MKKKGTTIQFAPPSKGLTAVLIASAAALTAVIPKATAGSQSQQPTLTCDGPTARHLVHLVEPRDCNILYPNRSLLSGAQMQRLKWSHWGAATATATGITHGFHKGPSSSIRVKVWQIRTSRCSKAGARWYTELRVKSGRHYHKTFNTAYC